MDENVIDLKDTIEEANRHVSEMVEFVDGDDDIAVKAREYVRKTREYIKVLEALSPDNQDGIRAAISNHILNSFDDIREGSA